MALPSKNSEQLQKTLEAAAQLFAHQGYHGTSTRDIARIAEISENTLFRQFEHKEDLFWAALRSRLSGLKLRRDLVDGIEESAEPRVVLPQILAQLVDTAILKPDLLRLIAIAFIELHWKGEGVCREYLSPVFAGVSRYLAGNVAQGKIRNLDPTMVTAALAVTVMVHPELSRLINGALPSHADRRDAIRAYSEFWLEVLLLPSRDRGWTPARVAEANSP